MGSSHDDQTCSKLRFNVCIVHLWPQLDTCSIQSPCWHHTATQMLCCEPHSDFGPPVINITIMLFFYCILLHNWLQYTNINTPYLFNIFTIHIISTNERLCSVTPRLSVVCDIREATDVVGLHPGDNKIYQLSNIECFQPVEDLFLHHFYSTLNKIVGVMPSRSEIISKTDGPLLMSPIHL